MLEEDLANGHRSFQHADPPSHLLIEAFKSFILPIVRVHASVASQLNISTSDPAEKQSISDMDSISLAPEAEQLFGALEKFVAAFLVGAPHSRNDRVQESHQESLTFAPEDDPSSSIDYSLEDDSALPEHPPLLKLALSKIPDRVFNEMPIRLLAFNSAGAGPQLELLERREISERISSTMIADFYTHRFDDIYPWNVPLDDPDKLEMAIEHLVLRRTHYVILSHTWLHDQPGEVTYTDWKNGIFDIGSKGYRKLIKFCEIASKTFGATFGWMDTICINKDSSAELDESIRSMYKWYGDANICIIYLAQTTNLQQIHEDIWFTRGWTLQELIAPQFIKFFGADWRAFTADTGNDKENTPILEQIEMATSLTPGEITKFPWMFPISRRMQWAANRCVTRAEDTAYSLMGIFEVDIPIAYGEGSERAFARLVKEIIMSSSILNVLDVLNWGSGPSYRSTRISSSSLIPSSPKQYIWGADTPIFFPRLRMPIDLTNVGLRLQILLMSATISASGVGQSYPPFDPIGKYWENVTIHPAMDELFQEAPLGPMHFNILANANLDGVASEGHDLFNKNFNQKHFGVLNFGEDAENIILPKYNVCFAVCLYSNGDFNPGNFSRIRTSEAISFFLQQVDTRSRTSVIPKAELMAHGMQLITMYL